ncbi:unnamed protein product [Prunus armeniaca]|uniref:Uncharacterized protein n=1 Tax=Prunus armeniaca TaxID=36596 RepID=A0A6J5UL38_PRUAR|nr:unnamed protein product [Prunus armeniaca]CAB4277266.1 unnamed protein product [Prunus armeniaca]CAB4307662.1 unnamed protein product [Prunus armeniaca]
MPASLVRAGSVWGQAKAGPAGLASHEIGVGGGVAIVARASLPTRRPAPDEAAASPRSSS